MKRSTLILMVVSVTAMLCLYLTAAEPNDVNDVNDIGSKTGIRPASLTKTALKTRVKLLENRVKKLEKQVKMLLSDNRKSKMDIEELDIKVKNISRSSDKNFRYYPRNERVPRRHRTTLTPK